MNRFLMRLTTFAVLFCLFHFSLSDPHKKGESLPVYVGKIQPFYNPSETYPFYALPFCAPKEQVEEKETLGELLTGSRKMNSKYDVKFQENKENATLCEKTLTLEDLDQFRQAIKENYIFEMFIDDFPVFDHVGREDGSRLFLKTKLKFVIGYLKNGELAYAYIQPTDVDPENQSSWKDEYVDITGKLNSVKFTYTVEFIAAEEGDAERLTDIKEGAEQEIEQQIHWLSIISAFIIVILLVGFVSVIISRVVRSDVNAINDPESGERGEIIGWKLIRIEVFQVPLQRNVLSAVIGSGMQLLLLVFILVALGCVGLYYGNQGSLNSAAILLYAFTAAVAGYVSARMYKYLGGKHWAFNLILTSLIYPVPFFAVWFVLNNMAWAAGSTAALPIGTILFILLLWALVTFPLTVVGGITGRLKFTDSLFEESKIPKVQKPIPEKAWWLQTIPAILISGLIPFLAILLELYYVYQSVWGHKAYSLYGVLLVAFILLLNVVICVNIAMTYFQLNSQDYRWWWRSFISGGSCALYIFLYSVYYYFNDSNMFGFLQGSFYFGYSFLISVALFLILGSVGLLSSMKFIQYIYSQSKID